MVLEGVGIVYIFSVCTCTHAVFINLVLQVMTAYALQRRLQNVGITVSSLHPGIVINFLSPQKMNIYTECMVSRAFLLIGQHGHCHQGLG